MSSLIKKYEVKHICPFCQKVINNSRPGRHIFNTHLEELFADPINLKNLHDNEYLKKPYPFVIDLETYYFVFADKAFFKTKPKADFHLYDKEPPNIRRIKKLRQQFPLHTEPAPQNTTQGTTKDITADETPLPPETIPIQVGERTIEVPLVLPKPSSSVFKKPSDTDFINARQANNPQQTFKIITTTKRIEKKE